MLRLITLQVYARSLDDVAPPGPVPPGVELVVAGRPMATGDLGERWHPEAERRLRGGQACAVARQGTDVVAYCWMAPTPVWVEEIANAVVPAPGEVYFYDAFTIPAWRGRGLFFGLLSRLLALAHNRGFRRGLIFVDTRNRASRRVIEKAGFEIVHAVSRLELCGFTRLWVRGRRASSSRVTLVGNSMTFGHEDDDRPGA